MLWNPEIFRRWNWLVIFFFFFKHLQLMKKLYWTNNPEIVQPINKNHENSDINQQNKSIDEWYLSQKVASIGISKLSYLYALLTIKSAIPGRIDLDECQNHIKGRRGCNMQMISNSAFLNDAGRRNMIRSSGYPLSSDMSFG